MDNRLDLKDGDFVTFTGKVVAVAQPKVADVDIRDIAHALSRVNRFGGHSAWPYSVAQHSVLVSRIVESEGGGPELQKAALVHDASEAYVGDVISPLKWQIKDYKPIELRWMRAIEEALGLPPQALDAAEIHRADEIAFHTEWRDMFPTRPLLREAVVSPIRVYPQGADAAKVAFMERYAALWGVSLPASLPPSGGAPRSF